MPSRLVVSTFAISRPALVRYLERARAAAPWLASIALISGSLACSTAQQGPSCNGAKCDAFDPEDQAYQACVDLDICSVPVTEDGERMFSMQVHGYEGFPDVYYSSGYFFPSEQLVEEFETEPDDSGFVRGFGAVKAIDLHVTGTAAGGSQQIDYWARYPLEEFDPDEVDDFGNPILRGRSIAGEPSMVLDRSSTRGTISELYFYDERLTLGDMGDCQTYVSQCQDGDYCDDIDEHECDHKLSLSATLSDDLDDTASLYVYVTAWRGDDFAECATPEGLAGTAGSEAIMWITDCCDQSFANHLGYCPDDAALCQSFESEYYETTMPSDDTDLCESVYDDYVNAMPLCVGDFGDQSSLALDCCDGFSADDYAFCMGYGNFVWLGGGGDDPVGSCTLDIDECNDVADPSECSLLEPDLQGELSECCVEGGAYSYGQAPLACEFVDNPSLAACEAYKDQIGPDEFDDCANGHPHTCDIPIAGQYFVDTCCTSYSDDLSCGW